MTDGELPAQKPESMTDEELAEKLQLLAGSTPIPDQKYSVYAFLHNVATADDTTKIGNLSQEELGMPTLPLRTDKSLGLWCSEIMENPVFANYFAKEAEITTSSSLSKDAKLINLAVLQRREIADTTKHRKPNKGWFKPKEKEEGEA